MEFWACQVLIWLNIVFYFVILVLVNMACTPYAYSWNKLIPGGSCSSRGINTAYTNLSSSIFNLIVDVLILLIPQRAIWKLQIKNRKRKVGVALVFTIGILGIVAAALRVYVGSLRALSPTSPTATRGCSARPPPRRHAPSSSSPARPCPRPFLSPGCRTPCRRCGCRFCR